MTQKRGYLGPQLNNCSSADSAGICFQRTGPRWRGRPGQAAGSKWRRFAAALLPRLFGNSIPGYTTRAPQVGFELTTNGIQFYVIANLDKTHCNPTVGHGQWLRPPASPGHLPDSASGLHWARGGRQVVVPAHRLWQAGPKLGLSTWAAACGTSDSVRIAGRTRTRAHTCWRLRHSGCEPGSGWRGPGEPWRCALPRRLRPASGPVSSAWPGSARLSRPSGGPLATAVTWNPVLVGGPLATWHRRDCARWRLLASGSKDHDSQRGGGRASCQCTDSERPSSAVEAGQGPGAAAAEVGGWSGGSQAQPWRRPAGLQLGLTSPAPPSADRGRPARHSANLKLTWSLGPSRSPAEWLGLTPRLRLTALPL